jgi:hypothetical protein
MPDKKYSADRKLFMQKTAALYFCTPDLLKMKTESFREQTKLWRVPDIAGLELMHATYLTQSFARHSHEGFAVGVIERGVLAFDYRGESLIASPGRINLANPDEAHTGHAAAETGWTYRMFYLDAELLGKAASADFIRLSPDAPKTFLFFRQAFFTTMSLPG